MHSIFFLLLLAVASCNQTSLYDERDGKTYKTVQIGTQTWMAENLNYNAEGSKCYGESGAVVTLKVDVHGVKTSEVTLSAAEVQENCEKYGRLYNWETALKACPKGWHLPSNEERQTLMDFAGGEKVAGKKLKSKSGWNNYENESGNGVDEYGFSALPGGFYGWSRHNFENPDSAFGSAGNGGIWWSASEKDSKLAHDWLMSYGHSDMNSYYSFKTYLYSVRCLKD